MFSLLELHKTHLLLFLTLNQPVPQEFNNEIKTLNIQIVK